MSDVATAFFEGLAGHGPEPLLKRAKGKIRFDVLDDQRVDHWLVKIDRGDVVVSRDNKDADCVVRTDRATLDGIVSGRVNTLAAFLRGLLEVEGDPQLVVFFQRMLPGPPDAHGPRQQAQERSAP